MVQFLKILSILLLSVFLQTLLFAQSAREKITNPTVDQLAAHFKDPVPEYGPTVTWGWQGYMDNATINRDLDSLQSHGFRMVTIEGGRMTDPYLSVGYFRLIKYAVDAAKKRGMKVWIIDEGKYPTGFAGGLFSKERPDLKMQALIAAERIDVAAGKTIVRKVASNMVSAVAYNGDSSEVISIHNGTIYWTAPEDKGDWKVIIAGHVFRTSPTRASNNPNGAKDTSNSLCDYLNPKAAKQFIQFTHEQYKKYIGSEFGKTVIGFRSDEPAYSYTPWTPDMLSEFKKQKGYDIRPYLASFFLRHPTEQEKLAKADYWEVFSNLFRDNFFKVISDWCVKNNLEYEDHIDHDGPEDSKTMLALGRSEGDYFKDMRYLQIPGIDVIWHQLWPGEANNFPKLASSAAHLFGRPQVFSESFAAFQPVPNIKQVKWVINEQLVGGINLFEIMFYPASTGQQRAFHGFMASDSFPAVMEATHRKDYILSNGVPAAKIGVYFPTPDLWLGDTLANYSTWNIAQQLLVHQRDFDFVDDQSLDSELELKNGSFINHRGQAYAAIIIPAVRIISENILKRLKVFAEQGGKVIFIGGTPFLVKEKTFLDAGLSKDINWAIKESGNTLTSKILQALPKPDVHLDTACADIRYLRRHLKDGEVYFFFNESNQRQARTATINGKGLVHVWNPENGKIIPVGGSYIQKGFTKIPLDLAPYESRIIVLGKLPGKFLSRQYKNKK
jgi:hypothetical protein